MNKLKIGDRFKDEGEVYRIIGFTSEYDYVDAVRVGEDPNRDGFMSLPAYRILMKRVPKLPKVSKKALKLIERLRYDKYPDLEAAKWGRQKAKYDLVKYISELENKA